MNTYIDHTGVRGMKWGRRKSSSSRSSGAKKSNKSPRKSPKISKKIVRKSMASVMKKKWKSISPDHKRLGASVAIAVLASVGRNFMMKNLMTKHYQQRRRSDNFWNNPNTAVGEVVEW